MASSDHKALVILGPTATGKTKLAASLAAELGAEIISVDSRQLYKGMDIGTGKDLEDLRPGGQNIPVHLLDVASSGQRLSLAEYLRLFDKALTDIRSRETLPILCGGTGLYLDAILRGYQLPDVDPDPVLRKALEVLSMDELADRLASFGQMHNTTDITDRDRLVRAIEIRTYQAKYPEAGERDALPALILGTRMPREALRERITTRLRQRLESGLIDEVRTLLDNGLETDDLEYYGLEYRYVGRYISGDLNFTDMSKQLNTAIHQFAKRQETWFRRMERHGLHIYWIDATEYLKNQHINALKIIAMHNFV